MKQQLLYLLLSTSILAIYATDLEHDIQQALQHYYASQFSDAIPGLKKAIKNHIDVQQNECRLAQCLAAQAIDTQNQDQLSDAIGLFVQSNNNFKASNSNDIVFVADEGLGDTIMWGYFLKALQTKNDRTYSLHLADKHFQPLLAPLLQQSGIINITTGDIAQHADKTMLPFVGAIVPELLFAPEKSPYLVANEQARTHWQKEILKHPGLKLVVTWCSSDKPVLGGRVLKRNLPLQALINIALRADPKAHIFLVQSQYDIIAQSRFDNMDEIEASLHHNHVIGDTYISHITPVVLAGNDDMFGPFQSTLALFKLGCKYLGTDTLTAHIASHAGASAAIVIPPTRIEFKPVIKPHCKDTVYRASNRDWRWGHNNKSFKGQSTAWYPEDKVRFFELNVHDPDQTAPVITFLKQQPELSK